MTSSSYRHLAQWFAGLVYAWVAVNVFAAPFRPGFQFQWTWAMAGGVAIFIVVQIWWLIMAYGFLNLPNMFWRCFVAGVLLSGVVHRISELPDAFRAHGVWAALRIVELLFGVSAVGVGSAIVIKTWRESRVPV